MSLLDAGGSFHNCNDRVIVVKGSDSYGHDRTLHAAPASVTNLRGRYESYMRRSLLATTFGLLAIAASASAAQQTSKPATTTAPTTATEKADSTKHHAKKEKAHKEKHKTGTTSTTSTTGTTGTTGSTEKKPASKP